MADGYRVTCSIEYKGQKYSNTAHVTAAQAADPPTRQKIRRYLQHQLIEDLVTRLGGFSFEMQPELDVSAFTVDATGDARKAEVSPPPQA
jgi:hypothetical protein